MRLARSLTVAMLLVLLPATARSAARYELYFDRTLGPESGARLVATGVTLMGAGEERLFRRLGDDGAGGIVARSLRTLVWDAPVAWWFGVAVHEGFGHGGRGREFRTSPSIRLGTPWESRVAFTSFDPTGTSTEELLYIYAGGVEANGLTATLLERRAVAGIRQGPLDLLFLVSNRLVLSDYVLRTTPPPGEEPGRFFREFTGGGDVANYLGLLNQLHGGGVGIRSTGVDGSVEREYERLRRQALWNALDPGVWWAIASVGRMIIRGDDAPPFNLPRMGRYRVLPVLSSEWTPSGGQTSFEWVAAEEGTSRWFSIVARRGRGPSGSFGALGAAADDLFPAGSWSLGGTAEAWRDPRNGLGGGARLRARLTRGALRGLYIDLGVKSQGYWVGQPATAGFYGAFGVSLGP